MNLASAATTDQAVVDSAIGIDLAQVRVELEPAYDVMVEEDGSFTCFIAAREGARPTHATLQVMLSRPEMLLWRGAKLCIRLTKMEREEDAYVLLRLAPEARVLEIDASGTPVHFYRANLLISD